VRVKLFAKFREIANADYIDIEASNIKELKEKEEALFIRI